VKTAGPTKRKANGLSLSNWPTSQLAFSTEQAPPPREKGCKPFFSKQLTGTVSCRSPPASFLSQAEE